MILENFDIEGQYIFIAPIDNLKISQEINGEFQIKNVLFVSKERLPRIRKRLGIPYKISKLKNDSKAWQDFFDNDVNTYAIIRHHGSLNHLESQCFQMVKDEITILAASQLGYIRRKDKCNIGLTGESHSHSVRGVFINKLTQNLSFLCKRSIGRGGQAHLHLTKAWKSYQKRTFFLDLLKIINKNVPVANKWRNTLERAAILIGKSYLCDDLPTSFLFNMIVLEILLIQHGDTYLKALPERMEAFLGWFGHWNFHNDIEHAYKLRNKFVHEGESNQITIRDLLFTDDLILNLLNNLCKLSNRFQKKEDIIALTEQVKVERILGLDSRVKPTIQYMSPIYSPQDFIEI